MVGIIPFIIWELAYTVLLFNGGNTTTYGIEISSYCITEVWACSISDVLDVKLVEESQRKLRCSIHSSVIKLVSKYKCEVCFLVYGPVLMAELSEALPLTANCLPQLPGFKS